MTITWRTCLAWLAGATLIAAGLTLVFAGPGAGATLGSAAQIPVQASGHPATPPGSQNAHGDNGTVKIHRSSTPEGDLRNEPHVCVFYLDAFFFDAGQQVSWRIVSWPPTGDRSVVASGTLVLDANGHGRTADMTLPNGHYKLYWNFVGENGRAKQKVFWVACESSSPSPTPTQTPTQSQSPTPSMSSSPTPSSSLLPTQTALPTPSPTSSSVGGGLPITGWPLALIAATGTILLGTGAVTLVLARRRRLHSSR